MGGMGQVQCCGSMAVGAAPPCCSQPCCSRSWRKDAKGPASLATPGSLEPSKKILQELVCYNLFIWYVSRGAFATKSLPAGGDKKERNHNLLCLPGK